MHTGMRAVEVVSHMQRGCNSHIHNGPRGRAFGVGLSSTRAARVPSANTHMTRHENLEQPRFCKEAHLQQPKSHFHHQACTTQRKRINSLPAGPVCNATHAYMPRRRGKSGLPPKLRTLLTLVTTQSMTSPLKGRKATQLNCTRNVAKPEPSLRIRPCTGVAPGVRAARRKPDWEHGDAGSDTAAAAASAVMAPAVAAEIIPAPRL